MFNIIGNLSFAAVMGSEVNVKPEKKCEPIMVNGKQLKPCCACPETKRPRDECIIEKGEASCGDLIEAHKACMRQLGFKI